MTEFIRTYSFEFFGQGLTAYLTSEREIYVPFIYLCDILGLNFERQLQRILDEGVISDMLESVKTTEHYWASTNPCNGLFLNLRALPYWLITIKAWWVKDQFRDSIVRFQMAAVKKVGVSMLLQMFQANTGSIFFNN